jgi:hypothetical protein
MSEQEYTIDAIAHRRIGDLPCAEPLRFEASPLPRFSIRADSVLDAWLAVKRIIPDRVGDVHHTGTMTSPDGNQWEIVDGTTIAAPRQP